MKYPKNLEYVKAIQNAGANLNKLAHLSPVMDDHGEPYHMSGDSSVVFKMQDKTTGKYYALKCFTIDPKELSDTHLQNAGEQNMDESSNSSSVKYLEKELLVYSRKKEKKYPVMLMEWVDEEAMGAFLAADEDLSTVATDEELNEAITDEFGVKYRKDGRKLLKAPQELDGTYSIRKGTKIVCDLAFHGCKSLDSLIIPDSVIGIGFGAFSDCESLSHLVFPNSITGIGAWAFEGCYSLKSLVIPGSVVNLNGNPFCRWDGELKCLSPYFIYDNKVLFDKDKSKIIAFRDKNTTSYVIPDSVSCIGSGAFYDCKSLHSIVIPDSVSCIGDCVFFHCESLSSVVIPDGVTSIGDYAFSGCCSLTDIVIPDSVTSIGESAFEGCTSLSSLVIPDSVTRIGNGAFNACYSLSNIVIPNGVTRIGSWTFGYCSSLSNIILPDGVTSIGDGAFVGCTSLKSLVIPNGVTRIGTWTFLYCSSLIDIIIPDSVTRIGSIAFQFCFSLSNIVVPDSVTRIGNRAFTFCNFPNDLKQKLISRFGEKIFG